MSDHVRLDKLNKEIEFTQASKKVNGIPGKKQTSINEKARIIADKSVKTAKNGALAIKEAGKDMVRTTSYQITDHTNDFYDSDPDFAENAAKQQVANTVYAARFAYRGRRSITNIPKKHKAKKNALNDFVKEEKQKFLDKNKCVSEEILQEKEAEFRKEGKKVVKDNKQAIYKENGIKAGIKPVQSSKRMIYNQSRKVINRIENKDLSGKIIGRSAKGVYYVARYHRAILRTIVTTLKFVKNVFAFGKAMVSSAVGLMVAVLTSLPFFLIFITIILVINMILSLTYTGRIVQFTDNEVYLEYRYQANVAPDEILAITQTLGWTSEDKEDYEALFALLLDGKDENWNISYDTMLDNIFNKYNPARYSWQDHKISVQRENIFGIDKTEFLNREDYLDLFPDYRNNPDTYGSDENVASMKNKVHQLLDENGQKYAGRFFYENFNQDPLNIEEIGANSATYKVGFRSFMNGAFHGGADIAAAEGTNAYAVTDGKVIATYNTATASGDICTNKDKRTIALCGLNHAGNQVVLQHEIIDKRSEEKSYLYIAYFHLQKGSVNVSVGDYVKAGDIIGKTGNTGMSFGGHLHFQSWIDAEDRYQLPATASGNAVIVSNENTIDPTMLCSIQFRNHIYGR